MKLTCFVPSQNNLPGSFSGLNLKGYLWKKKEEEGITLIITQETALTHQLAFSGAFRQITLTVHSSLEAVGLTAAVSKALADNNISANVVAAYYHDHIFVPEQDAERALNTLIELQQQHAKII